MINVIKLRRTALMTTSLTLLMTACSSDHLIQSQDDLDQEDLSALSVAGIINDSDTVHYHYQQRGNASAANAMLSDEALSIVEDENVTSGALFTDTNVLTYTMSGSSTDEALVERIPISSIQSMSYDAYEFGPDQAHAMINVTGSDGTKLTIILPDEKQRDEAFYEALRAHWEADPKTAKLLELSAAGLIPARDPQYAANVPEPVSEQLRAEGILLPEEQIEIFYAHEPIDFLQQGYLLTSERVVVYNTNPATGERKVQSAQLSEVTNIVVRDKYQYASDGSASIRTDKHLQIFAKDKFLFGFDDHDIFPDGMVNYKLMRLWSKASPVLNQYNKDKSSGNLPSLHAATKEQLPDFVKQALLQEEIVTPEEEIIYFDTDYPLSFTYFGTIATDQRVIQYEIKDNGTARETLSYNYTDISHIQMEKDEYGRYDSKIYIYENGEYRLRLDAPLAQGVDDTIYATITQHWQLAKQ